MADDDGPVVGEREPMATVTWRVHLDSPPARVFALLDTADGRRRFWAESAAEADGVIEFRFPNGLAWRGAVLERRPPHRFVLTYIGESTVTFELADDGGGGTDLTLTDSGVSPEEDREVRAGWVSVLLALKAAADHGVDLRNHDPRRTWDAGFVDN